MTGRIVVGVDGSPPSRHALRWAVEEARLRGCTVEAIYAWSHPYIDAAPIFGEPAILDVENDARMHLDRLLADEGLTLDGDPSVEGILVNGPADRMLVEAAKGADHLVVGSRGWGEVRGMLLGSISQHCVAHAPCPVTVVRETE